MISPANKLTIIAVYFFSKLFFFMGLRLCRFTPTCSAYAVEAFERHGFWKACFLTGKRLLRCHPFCAGGWDPLPRTF